MNLNFQKRESNQQHIILENSKKEFNHQLKILVNSKLIQAVKEFSHQHNKLTHQAGCQQLLLVLLGTLKVQLQIQIRK